MILAIATAALPLVGAIATAVAGRAHVLGLISSVAGLASFGCAVALAARVLTGSTVEGLNGFLYVDPLAAFFLITVSIVIALSALGSLSYLRTEERLSSLSRTQVRVYFAAFGVFGAMMLASLESGNLGLLWILIEASTLASAVLVGLEATGPALEAAWKYVIISSLGVTMALVATLLLFFSASRIGLGSTQSLIWQHLFAHAQGLLESPLRLAFLLAVVGYGTKVGLAPMHTWLPDAHSEAPSPASAMLSAALLNTGMYAIMRFKTISSVQLGAGYTGTVLLVFGFLSIAVGGLFMVGQGNFKRLFAYSSVEHMGIISVALGFGGVLGFYGALLHTLNHAIGKSILFLSSGDIVHRYRTRKIADVRGLLRMLPLTGGVLFLGSLAIVGSPPFGLFLSELTIVRAGFASTDALPAALLLGLLVLVFIAFMHAAARMSLGEATALESASGGEHRTPLASTAPLVAGLGALLVLGLWIPAGLNELIMRSVGVLSS